MVFIWRKFCFIWSFFQKIMWSLKRPTYAIIAVNLLLFRFPNSAANRCRCNCYYELKYQLWLLLSTQISNNTRPLLPQTPTYFIEPFYPLRPAQAQPQKINKLKSLNPLGFCLTLYLLPQPFCGMSFSRFVLIFEWFFLPAAKHAGLWIIIGPPLSFVWIISRKPLQAGEAWEYG